MVNRKKTVMAALLTVAAGVTALAGTAEAKGGVMVEQNDASATGYTVTFTYYDEAAANVRINGSFLFYEPGDEYVYSAGRLNEDGEILDKAGHLYTPEAWKPDLCHYKDSDYVQELTKDEETGAWITSMDLPSGSYLYQYVVTAADGTEQTIADPENIPFCNSLGAKQERCQFYVPYDAAKQNGAQDWSFVLPAEDESKRGELKHEYYEGVTCESTGESVHPVEIYLPAGYDKNREEPYKTLYLVHGGGGESGDWFHQGNAGNIMDRLVAEGRIEEFVMVAIEASAGTDEELCKNIAEYTIPYIEAEYHVSVDVADRAIVGLSKGGKLTRAAMDSIKDCFHYYGILSSSCYAFEDHMLESLKNGEIELYLGCGYADQTIGCPTLEGQIPMAEMVGYLDESGAVFKGLTVVEGGHDWFTWPQLLKDLMESFLWK